MNPIRFPFLRRKNSRTTLFSGRGRILAGSVALLAAAVVPTPEANAVIYFWDSNGAGTPGFTTVTGAWNGTNLFWNTDSTGGAGGTTTAVPTNADDLNITAGTTGTITITGTGTGSSLTISDNVATIITGGTLALGGSGVSGSGLFVTSADNAATTIASALTLNVGAVSLQNAGTGVLSFTGGITGAQALILNNNGATANGITISTGSLNNGGTVTNFGTGAGLTLISSVIGTSVLGVVQNSATSQLTLSNAANTFTSAVTITQGQLNATSVTGFGAIAATSSLSDFPRYGF